MELDAFTQVEGVSQAIIGDVPFGRQTSEDALLKDAVNAFKARAQLATEALGGKGYKIVNLNFNTNGYPQPFMRAPTMMMKSGSMDAESVTPDVEAGTSKVIMTADGVVEVLMQ